ncbi:TadE/TadG family type IV pilus assembly protein [Limimaricola hongkongensis]|nr:hypothetical protein [Limimaricola hongkongensis]
MSGGVVSRAARLLRRLGRRDHGAMVVEGVIMLPLLVWCFAGSWVFFDAYRAQSTNARAAYTIGDALSRESNYITPAYVDSLFALQDFLVTSGDTPRLRVSVFRYDAATDSYAVAWSIGRGTGVSLLTDGLLAGMRDELPVMPDHEIATLVETWVDYSPVFDVGIVPFTFEDRVVTRLRFAGQLCFNPTGLIDDRIC